MGDENDTKPSELGRREFLGAAATAAASATLLSSGLAHADAAPPPPPPGLAASPPPGFVPWSAPGKVIKVSKPGSLMPNQIYPKADDAKVMLEKALTELTGKPTMVDAIKLFLHPADKVVVKLNGIALANMSTNKELVLPFLDAMIAAGIPAGNITVLEQYPSFLMGTRVSAQNVPHGVNVNVHNNTDATMAARIITGTGVQTKFVRALTESTAVVNFALIKDHSICGYTGTLKNMTHGCTINPHDFHLHHASPQIALLAAQDVIKSRVRLTITDAFKVMCNGGPLDKMPQFRLPYEAVFASTDMVAMDTIGWEIVEDFRKKKNLRSLTDEGRPPSYIKAAGDLGLGISDRAKISFREVTV